MKETYIKAKSAKTNPLPIVDRRAFVKLGAVGFGVLGAASSALATFPLFRNSRPPVVPQGPGLMQLPPQMPGQAFEPSSGVNPQFMVQMVQQYIAMTLTPDFAGQVVQAELVQRVPGDFHQIYWSDFRLFGQIPPTRTRFGYYVGVSEVVRSDAQIAIRNYQDLNYFEMRRLINPSELNQFGLVLQPFSFRRMPVQADVDAFFRVARINYNVANPAAFQLMYVRQFTDGRSVFNGYLMANGPEPMRSPYKDLLIDNIPVRV